MSRALDLAQTLWDYHVIGGVTRPCDLIFLLCSDDLRVADRAAELHAQGIAPRIAISGGVGILTRGLFPASEAEAFAGRLAGLGVPASALILETAATNTGENVLFTRRLLGRLGIAVRSAVCVQKPFMERRTLATVAKLWPELSASVTSPRVGFADWCAGAADADRVISTMVGDLQRIIAYPARGYQIPQEVPAAVLAAMQELIRLGFDRHPLPAAP